MRLARLLRPAGFVVLALVTSVGLWRFLSGDPGTVVAQWLGMTHLLPLVLGLAIADVLLEAVSWLWVYGRCGVRSWNRGAVLAFLSGRAGLLLPAQLGRLVRPDAMARQGQGSMGTCLKAEGAAFLLDALSVVSLILALLAWHFSPWLAPLLGLGAIVAALFCAERLGRLFATTRLAMPSGFWWSWSTLAIVLIQTLGWAAHGIGLWVMIRELAPTVSPGDTILFTSASSVLGASTGMPGGIGATEALLGISLSIVRVPEAHLVAVIGSFRLFTFWMWIPIGWMALVLTNRHFAVVDKESTRVRLARAG